MSDMITTYTGIHLDPRDPQPDQIRIEDIAHALSMLCRGNGHVQTFYSVGQHCILCAREALARGYSKRVALACLLHDASECYLSDVPRPFKQHLGDYRQFEEHLLGVIYTAFLGDALSQEEAALLKHIDDDELYFDIKVLLKDEPDFEEPRLCIMPDYTVRAFADVEREYLTLFRELREGIRQIL